MKILLLILIVLSTNSLLFPQNGTFERSYANFEEGYQVLEYPDGGYVVGGISHFQYFVSRTDEEGNILFSHVLESSVTSGSDRTFPIEITSDGDILIATAGRINNFIVPYIIKMNNRCEILWEKYYPQFEEYRGTDVMKGEGGDIYLLSSNNSGPFFALLLKLDKDGRILWNREYSLTPSFIRIGNSMGKLGGNNLLLALNRDLFKVDSNGEVIWQYLSDYKIQSAKPASTNSIITAGSYDISKLDSTGNLIWKKQLQLPGIIESMDVTKNSELLFILDGKTLVKTNLDGEILWSRDLREYAHYVHSAEFGDILVTGYVKQPTGIGNSQWEKRLRLTKTDAKGFYNAMDLIYSASIIYEKSGVYWFTSGVDFVDLDFSDESGQTWNRIVSNYPADSGYYDWQTPEEFLIRIKNSFNPEQFVITKCDLYGSTVDMYDYIAVNDVLMWVSNNGDGSHSPITDGNGFYWPGGIDATQSAIFEDGLVYGGKVGGILSVNGNTHRQGLINGSILSNGMGDDPFDPKYKIYKINKSWETLPEGSTKTRLKYDYENWPAEYGAPWEDVNENGIFEKGIDLPEFIGDEVLFYVANDMDEERTKFTYGSLPLGLEFQTTIFGFDSDDFLTDVVFKRYRILNKSREIIEGMYLSFFTDDDMGDASDDFVGCDTTLNLGFTYNGEEFDAIYGSAPPAVGHMVVQGPVREGEPEDRAMFKGKWIKGFENVSMNAFTFYIGGSALFNDPAMATHEGAEMFYNNMQGLIWNGDTLRDPVTNSPTFTWLSGDPVNNIGWYEGSGWPGGSPANDRRYVMSFGPFDFAPADTQEIVLAVFMDQGSDNINSVAELKKTGRKIHEFYQNEIISGNITSAGFGKDNIEYNFNLSQNYPNPFNPTTTIKYEIPDQSVGTGDDLNPIHPDADVRTRNVPTLIQSGQSAKLYVRTGDDLNKTNSIRNSKGHHLSLPNIRVKLIVYDILGREIKILVNEIQSPGIYEIEFNAGNLASGIYFYRLETGAFTQVKKMILLR